MNKKILQSSGAAIAIILILSACSAKPGTAPKSNAKKTTVATACTPVDPSHFVDPGTLTVSVSGTAPPLDTVADDGSPAGMYIDLVNDWAAALKIPKVKFVPGAFSSLVTGLIAGQWDMGGAAPSFTEERRNAGTFLLSTPYLASGTSLLVPKDGDIQSWSDVKGKTIGGATGEAEYKNAVKEGHPAKSLGFDGADKARQALRSGLVDAVAGDYLELEYYVSTAPDGNKFKVLKPIDELPMGTFFGLKETSLRDGVNCVIKEQLADGSMAALAKKWYGNSAGVDAVLKLEH